MSKKKNKSNKLILVAIASVLALASVAVIFAPAFVNKASGTSFTGLQSAFGYSETSGIITIKILSMNILSLIAFLLPLVAMLLSLVMYKNKMACTISALVYFAAAVCSFLAVLTFKNSVIGASLLTLEWTMGIGTILCGVFSALAGLVMAYRVAKK